MATTDAVWNEHDTTPDAIEAALRRLLAERHAENESFVPARVLNMITFVDDEWSGEIANRLRRVGNYNASRLLVLSYDPRRDSLDARVSIASDVDPEPGQLALLREIVVVRIGRRHLADLLTIADPLVVTDLPTLLWSPHGHPEVVDTLLELSQAMLLDSVEEPVWRDAIDRAYALSEQAYVVDLAWLRTTPWRERIAATFDPAARRAELCQLESVTVRHHVDSTVAAMLVVAWLASRLGWEIESLHSSGHALVGSARAEQGEVELRLEAAPELQVPGLEGLTLKTSAERELSMDRGPGGLHARSRNGADEEREWTIPGASRGEAGILGEGIRQALLRDPTYVPALTAARAMLP